jgi:UDP-N-acetylmuramoyl-L-alanyl-D-glutamate--2,6-diaminopimelate ligase
MQKTGVITRFKINVHAQIMALRHGRPSSKMRLVMVVGSDGTGGTVAFLASILRCAGHKVGVITKEYIEVNGDRAKGSDQADVSANPQRLQELLAQMRRAKCNYVLLEVPPELPHHQFVGIQPHMIIVRRCGDDYTDQIVVQARMAMLNTLLGRSPKFMVFNRDDPCGSELSHLSDQPGVISYGTHQKADCKITEVALHPKGSKVELLVDHHINIHLATHLVGKQTIYNAAAAAAGAYVLHMPIEAIEQAVLEQKQVPGLCEEVPIQRPYQIVLDAAATPGGLAETLETYKHFAKNRLVVMMGAPLGTPPQWLPLLGEIATKYADRLIITDGEFTASQSPQEVRAHIMQGVVAVGGEAKTEEIANRQEAIEKAVSIARRGDIVVLAAITQHPYRQLGDERHTWNDRKVVESLFE